MPSATQSSSDWIEWGVAARPIPGETQSGDTHVVAPFADGVLIAVIDGLGHGPEAAEVARLAANELSSAPSLPLRRLVERCHAGLHNSRGAVMTLVALDTTTDRLTWTGVGNVEAVLCHEKPDGTAARETLVPRSGVVGYQLPTLRESMLSIVRGDVIVLATDGLRHDFILEAPSQTDAQEFADHLLDRYGRKTDDALVLVVRYRGHPT